MRSQLPYWRYDEPLGQEEEEEELPAEEEYFPPFASRSLVQRRSLRTTDEQGYLPYHRASSQKALSRSRQTETIRVPAPRPEKCHRLFASVTFKGSLSFLCLCALVGYLIFFLLMRGVNGAMDLAHYGPHPTVIATLPPAPGAKTTLPRNVAVINAEGHLTVILPDENGQSAQIITIPLDARAWGNVDAVVPTEITPGQNGEIVILLQGEPALFPAWERPSAAVHLARQSDGHYRLVSIVPA